MASNASPDDNQQDKSENRERLLKSLDAINPQDPTQNKWLQGVSLDDDFCQQVASLVKSATPTSETKKADENANENGNFDGVLWVTGSMDGDTMIFMTAFLQHLSKHKDTTSQPSQAAFFFCKSEGPKVTHAAAVVKSLIWQLISQQPSLIKHLENKHKSTERNRFDSPNDFLAMSGVLYDMLNDQTLPVTYLVLDAVDEIPIYGGCPGPDDLLRLIGITTYNCPNTKWIISTKFSSRTRDLLRQRCDNVFHLDLDHHRRHMYPVIDNYMSKKISSLAEARRFWPGLRELSGAELCIHVLSTMEIALQPLHISELAALSKLPEGVHAETIVRKCSVFLDIHEGIVYFPRKSIRGHIRQALPSNEISNHAMMVQRCLLVLSKFLSKWVLESLTAPTKRPIKKVEDADPIRYSMTGWIEHAMALEDMPSILDALEAITTFLKGYTIQWIEVLILTSSLPRAFAMIRNLYLSLRASKRIPADVADVLLDAHRLLDSYMGYDSLSPNIHSTLLFCSDKIRAKNSYISDLLPWVKTPPIIEDNHDPLALKGHSNDTMIITFSPDGRLLATISDHHPTVRVWDVSTGTIQHTWDKHRATNVAISSTGMIAIGWGEKVTVWLTGESQEILKLYTIYDRIRRLSFSNDGSKLAVSLYNSICLYDIPTSGSPSPYPKVRNPGRFAVFSPDDHLVASFRAPDRNTIQIWNAKTLELVEDLKGHEDFISMVVFSPDGSRMASCSNDQSIIIWDTRTWGEIARLPCGDKSIISCYVTSCSFLSDGVRFASVDFNNVIRIWNIETQEQQDTIRDYMNMHRPIVISPDGWYLASSDKKSGIRFWYVGDEVKNTVKENHSNFSIPDQTMINDISISANGKYIASGHHDDGIFRFRLWDGETGQRIYEVKLTDFFTGHQGHINSLVFSPNESILATASNDGAIRLWDTSSGKMTHCLTGHGNKPAKCVTFSPDGKLIASVSDDILVVHDIEEQADDIATPSKKVVYPGWPHFQTVTFSPNGEFIVAGGSKEIIVWNAHTLELGKTIKIDHIVVCVAVSIDSARILALYQKRWNGRWTEVRMWELQTGKSLHTVNREEYDREYKFSFDANDPDYVVTALGARLLQKGEDEGTVELGQQRPPWCPYALTRDTKTFRWVITWNGHPVINIPRQYGYIKPLNRCLLACVVGKKIAIGSVLGEVLLFSFSDEIEPRVLENS